MKKKLCNFSMLHVVQQQRWVQQQFHGLIRCYFSNKLKKKNFTIFTI